MFVYLEKAGVVLNYTKIRSIKNGLGMVGDLTMDDSHLIVKYMDGYQEVYKYFIKKDLTEDFDKLTKDICKADGGV